MYVLTPDELFELLKLAVPEPNLTIETIAQLLYQYRDGNLPVKQSTADMNKALGKIGIQGKGNRGIRGELCICFVHMKMWNRHDVPLGVVELCKRYDLDRFDVERDPYFRRYCYYLCPVLDIVEPGKHREFIIQDVLVPLSSARGIKYITGSGKEASRTMIRYKAFEIESHWFRPKTLTMIDGIERRPSPRPTDGGLIKKRSMQFIANPALKIKLNCNQKFPDQSLPLASGLLRIDRTDYLTGDTISTTNTNLTTNTSNTTSTTTASNNLNAYKTYVVWENVVEFQKGKRKAYSSYPRNKKPKLPPGYSQNPDSCQTSSNSNNSNYNMMYTNKDVLNNTNEEEKQKRSLYYTNNYEYTPPSNEDSQYVHNTPQYVHNPQHYVMDSQPGPQYVQNTSATTDIYYVTPENSQERCAQEYFEESQRNQLSTSPLPPHHLTQQQETSKPSRPGLFASYADALFDAQLAVHHQQRQYNLMMNCNHYSPHYIEAGGYMTEGGYNKPSFYPSKDGFIAIPHISESNYPTGRYAPSAALCMGNEMWKRGGVQQGSAAAAGVDRVMYMQSDYAQRTPAPTTAFADRGMMYHAVPPHVAADRGMMKYAASDHAQLPLPPPVLAPSPVEHEDDELLQACADALVKIGYNVHKTRVKSDLLLTQCGV